MNGLLIEQEHILKYLAKLGMTTTTTSRKLLEAIKTVLPSNARLVEVYNDDYFFIVGEDETQRIYTHKEVYDEAMVWSIKSCKQVSVVQLSKSEIESMNEDLLDMLDTDKIMRAILSNVTFVTATLDIGLSKLDMAIYALLCARAQDTKTITGQAKYDNRLDYAKSLLEEIN